MKDCNGLVGIITFHRSRNYGAVLQTYALQTYIKLLEKEVKVLDYQNEEIAKVVKLWNNTKQLSIKEIIRSIMQFIYRAKKEVSFRSFIRKKLFLSPKIDCNKLRTDFLQEKYDYFITGSDQVWNKNITDNDNIYFLDFVGEKISKIAYAVSAGDKIDGNCSENIGDLIKDFSAISVREQILQEYIERKYQITSEVCCDPTMLLSKEDYLSLIKKNFESKRYVFVYTIQDAPELIEFAKKFSAERNLCLVTNKNCLKFWLKCSPDDFLNWVYHAEYVITNSFHGTVFSVLFHKHFLSYVKKGDEVRNERICALLERFNLESKAVIDLDFEYSKECLQREIDFEMVDDKVESYRVSSRKFLMKSLEVTRIEDKGFGNC